MVAERIRQGGINTAIVDEGVDVREVHETARLVPLAETEGSRTGGRETI